MTDKAYQKRRLQEALKLRPEIKIIKFLGGGNHGEAYSTENGYVIKITNDKEEYCTAKLLIGKKLRHIIEIYECWRFKCVYTDGDSDFLYCIIEEHIDTDSKKEIISNFVGQFKHAWFSLYFPNFEYKNGTFDDLERCMKKQYFYANAIQYTKQFVLTEGEKRYSRKDFETLHDQLLAAYDELNAYVPQSHLDLNDGNLGLSSKGVLKIFDIQ
ncbi:MAG: hypothetical protein Q8909_19475 [Bacteroidota bacterium]|nr:hypothetical protein [Bacteroidota bacterium]